MKHLLKKIMLAIMVLCISCQKDTIVPVPERYNDGIVRFPISGAFYSTLVDNIEWITCVPEDWGDKKIAKSYRVGGTGAYLGEVQLMKSTMTFTSCDFFKMEEIDGGGTQLQTNGEGVLTAINGDEMKYFIIAYFNEGDTGFFGTFLINGGTGQFNRSYGQMRIEGTYDKQNGTAEWMASGYIILRNE